MEQMHVTRLRRRSGWSKGMTVSMIAVSFICVAVIYAEIAHAEEITLTAFDYPPLMDESLPGKGLFCELVSEAYQSVGYTVSFTFYPLKRSTQYVIDGEALAQLGNEWNFPEDARKQDVQSAPLFYYRVVGFHLRDKFNTMSFKTLKDLQGYRLGVILGSAVERLMVNSGLNLHVEAVPTMEQLFKKVYANRNDIGFVVDLSGLASIAKYFPNEQDRWVMTEDAILGIVGQVVFSKKYPEMEKYLNSFNEGVQWIRDNGTYLRVLEKYYGIGKVPGVVSDLSKERYVIPKE